MRYRYHRTGIYEYKVDTLVKHDLVVRWILAFAFTVAILFIVTPLLTLVRIRYGDMWSTLLMVLVLFFYLVVVRGITRRGQMK